LFLRPLVVAASSELVLSELVFELFDLLAPATARALLARGITLVLAGGITRGIIREIIAGGIVAGGIVAGGIAGGVGDVGAT
jgi:hypothetical protein